MKLNLKTSLCMLRVVALLGVAACGGSNSQNQQPMTPAAGANQPGMTGTETTPQPGMNENQGAPTNDMSGATPQGGVNPNQGGMGGTGQPGMTGSGQGGTMGGNTGMSGNTAGGGTMGGTGGSAMGGAGMGADQGTLSDAQIASVLDTINRGEEKEAQLAVTKAKDAKVKQFAQMMLTGHRDANRRLMADIKKANITPSQSAVSTQLDNDVTQMMDNLRNKTGMDFDKGYMDDQVKLHTQALDMIDNRLIPNAKDATLKSDLQTLRASVADHLRRAQDIQSTLQGGSTNTQPSGSQGGSQSGTQQYPKH